MLRAVFVNGEIRRRHPPGASTLTQQPAAAARDRQRNRPTPASSTEIPVFAADPGGALDKRTILEAYFNQVDLGQRSAQTDPAAWPRTSSSGSAATCARPSSTEQIALMITGRGLSWYNPRRNPERATERRNFVLAKMRARTT